MNKKKKLSIKRNGITLNPGVENLMKIFSGKVSKIVAMNSVDLKQLRKEKWRKCSKV